MPDQHAYLSASASQRWLLCPPSAALCAKLPDTSSSYAIEGTEAHRLCEYLLLRALGHKVRGPTQELDFYNEQMQSSAEGYRDFVLEQIEAAKEQSSDVEVKVEERLDFSRWVPEGFGTGDCVIVAQGLIHIIDFKYGSIEVPAAGEDGHGNTQLKCYALGVLDAYDFLYDIQEIKLSIYQPRREHYDTFTLTRTELLDWANNILAPVSQLAMKGEGDFKAGEHCRFCKVKATCRERANHNLELAKYDFAEPAELSIDEISDILPTINDLTSWASDVKAYALNQALAGQKFPGYKVVEGRSIRKYKDEAQVAQVVTSAGFDPYEKKLLGITAMTKELGSKRFKELLGDFVYKPQGKPVLVPESDKRPELDTAANDFMEE